ncbi:MAG: histidine kinase [Bacteroidia bacterium]
MKIPKHWYTRLLVSALLALTALAVRRLLIGFDFSFQKDLFITITTYLILVLGWTFFANINHQLEKYFPFNKNTSLRISIQIILGVVFILIIRLGGKFLMRNELPFTPEPIVIAMMIGLDIFLALTINLAVISHYIIKKWKESITRTEKLEQEKMQMQYLTLKNQVNPHFLFNTFASLQAMIIADSLAASKYVGHLAKVYRYAIGNDENVLVSVEKELEILKLYIEVLKMRYRQQISFEISIDEETMDKQIVHMTLQNLMDNALKHNEIHVDFPLQITISNTSSHILVTNSLRIKHQHVESTEQGLNQLKRLYRFYSEEPFVYGVVENNFEVKIPLI